MVTTSRDGSASYPPDQRAAERGLSWWQRGRGLLWDCLSFPWRLFRRRISLQLIASHVLIVLLSLLVTYVVVFGALYDLVPRQILGEDAFLDYAIGERARAVAFRLDADAVARLAAGDNPSQMNATLRDLLPPEATGEADPRPAASWLTSIDDMAVIGPDGLVLASTNPDWAMSGRSISAAAPLVASVTQQALAMNGNVAPGLDDFSYGIDNVDTVTVASHPILNDTGGVVGVVTVQSIPADIRDVGSFWEIVTYVYETQRRTLLITALSALTIAVPLGTWRARSVSARLNRVAGAAEAVSRGDLERRVPVQGTDEIARVSEQFNDMSDRLAAADQARRTFVANVSHELRTPVAIIQGHVESLLDESKRAAQEAPSQGDAPVNGGRRPHAAPLEVIHQETLTLSHLIDDLFTVARVEASVLPLNTRPVAVADLIRERVAGIRESAWRQRKIVVETQLPGALPAVVADPTRLRQILNNLLYNALRHTLEGGLILVDAAAGESHVTVSVSDTGIGIGKEELATIFDRFHRSQRTENGVDGTGLGLQIVKALVEAQGGQVSATSAAGQGSVFSFTIPRAP